jgi:uncharacterized membrane protein
LANKSILRQLPFDVLQNPDRQAIHAFLKKKVQIFKRLKLSSIVVSIIIAPMFYFFANLDSTIKGIPLVVTLNDFIPMIIFPILAIIFHRLAKQYNLTDREIDIEINKYKSKQNVPA